MYFRNWMSIGCQIGSCIYEISINELNFVKKYYDFPILELKLSLVVALKIIYQASVGFKLA